MRLLLTSEGLTNSSIRQALIDLCPRPPEQCRVAFIPTSGNMLDIDKRWLLLHLRQIERVHFELFDIVDFTALPYDTSVERLDAADVWVMGGGDVPYLMEAIDRTGIADYLRVTIPGKVYVGISAGSICTGPDTSTGGRTRAWTDDGFGLAVGDPALGLVDLRIRPHYGHENHPHVNDERMRRLSRTFAGPLYGLHDQSALLVVDDQVSVVGKGAVKCFQDGKVVEVAAK